MAKEIDEPLLVSGHYEYSNRPRRDGFWGVLYIVFLLVTIAGGIFGVVHRNSDYARLIQQDDPKSCPVGGNKGLGQEPGEFSVTEFMKVASIWLLISAGASLLLGFVFIALFKHYASAVVKLTIGIQVLIPLAAGLASIFSGQLVGGLIMLGMAVLAGFVFWLWQKEIDLCARLLGVSAAGLNDNPGLSWLVAAMQVVLLVLILPMLGFLAVSYTNGDLEPNSARDLRQSTKVCVDSDGQQVNCCEWVAESWVGAYAGLSSVTLLWTTFLVAELRVFVVSGTIAQWYFMPAGLSTTKGTTMRSLRHGLGPSFGSLALGSAILTLIQLARNAIEKARQQRENRENLLIIIAGCIASCVFALIEFLTKFATVQAAITGEAFFAAGRSATDLLARNFLKTYGVWWFPPLVLHTAAFLLSAAWGLSLFTASYLSWSHRENGKNEAVLLGVLTGLMAWMVLAFFSNLLLNIVDAVYLCYAMDKDVSAVSRPEVHDVFSQVPVTAAGPVVEQPGGEYSYGAPQGGYVPAAGGYPHPSAPTAPSGYPHPSAPPGYQQYNDGMSRV